MLLALLPAVALAQDALPAPVVAQDAAIALGLPDLAADAGSALAAYGAGWLSHRTGRRWARRCVPVVKLVAGAVVRALVEALVMGGDWRTGALRGLVSGAAAVSGRQVWSRALRGRVRE